MADERPKLKATHKGEVKPDSEVFRRGYTINLAPGKPKEKTADKPAPKEEK